MNDVPTTNMMNRIMKSRTTVTSWQEIDGKREDQEESNVLNKRDR